MAQVFKTVFGSEDTAFKPDGTMTQPARSVKVKSDHEITEVDVKLGEFPYPDPDVPLRQHVLDFAGSCTRVWSASSPTTT